MSKKIFLSSLLLSAAVAVSGGLNAQGLTIEEEIKEKILCPRACEYNQMAQGFLVDFGESVKKDPQVYSEVAEDWANEEILNPLFVILRNLRVNGAENLKDGYTNAFKIWVNSTINFLGNNTNTMMEFVNNLYKSICNGVECKSLVDAQAESGDEDAEFLQNRTSAGQNAYSTQGQANETVAEAANYTQTQVNETVVKEENDL